jgi:hypothetical protein
MFRKSLIFAGVAAVGLSFSACRPDEPAYDTAPPPPATTPPPAMTPPPATPMPYDTLHDTIPGMRPGMPGQPGMPGAPGTPGTGPGTTGPGTGPGTGGN